MSEPIFVARSDLLVRVGASALALPAFGMSSGEALAIVPPPGLGADLGVALARVLTTFRAPASGTIALYGLDPATLSYYELTRLRTRLGFVPGSGGLLSNRSLRANLALPISVHLPRDFTRVDELLTLLELTEVAERRPHEVDEETRFRACVARALALSPSWLVVEGSGDFDGDHGTSLSWRRLLEARSSGAALAVCLPRPMPAFQRWFEAQGGRIQHARSVLAPEGKTA